MKFADYGLIVYDHIAYTINKLGSKYVEIPILNGDYLIEAVMPSLGFTYFIPEVKSQETFYVGILDVKADRFLGVNNYPPGFPKEAEDFYRKSRVGHSFYDPDGTSNKMNLVEFTLFIQLLHKHKVLNLNSLKK